MRLWGAAAFFGACAYVGYNWGAPRLVAWLKRPPEPPNLRLSAHLKPEYVVEFRTLVLACLKRGYGAEYCVEHGNEAYGAPVLQIEVGRDASNYTVYVDCSERLSPLHVATCRNAGWRP